MRIGTKNIEDWGIVTSIDIGSPTVKKKEYEVPGLSGTIDASEILTGYPIYGNRPVQLEIYIHGKTPEECVDLIIQYACLNVTQCFVAR